ncbi:MAG: hypothetical protein QOD71_1736 [Thermoleophilaceae bacterium]|nr:hypothetical protein [Thermoleophilaceae bacterium]
MEVTLLLCDAAQEANGKLYVLGGGWKSVLPDTPFNMALAILIEVPWDQTNRKIKLTSVLMTDDGDPVEAPSGGVIEAAGDLEVGRPPGIKPGTGINVPIALSFNGVSLPAGGYRWEVHIDETMIASAPFRAGA